MAMKKELKKVNWYRVEDVIVMVGVLLFILVLCKKMDVITFLFSETGVFLLCVLVVFLLKKNYIGDTVVENETEHDIYSKDEESSNVVVIPSHERVSGIDGIKVDGVVYKLCSGTHVVVKENGKVRTKSLTGKLVNNTRGGKISSPPDEGWNNLFLSIA